MEIITNCAVTQAISTKIMRYTMKINSSNFPSTGEFLWKFFAVQICGAIIWSLKYFEYADDTWTWKSAAGF